jgi:hypothetical protein
MCYLSPGKFDRGKMSSVLLLKKPPPSLVWAFLGIFLVSGCPLLGSGQEQASSEKTLGPLEKSLIIPGWGQLSEKRYIEGAFFLAAEAFCIFKIFVNDHAANRNYGLYKKAETVDDAVRFRQLTEQFDRRRNQSLLAAAGVWALNLLDIFLIVKNKESKDKAFSLRIERGEHQTLSLTAAYRF